MYLYVSNSAVGPLGDLEPPWTLKGALQRVRALVGLSPGLSPGPWALPWALVSTGPSGGPAGIGPCWGPYKYVK